MKRYAFTLIELIFAIVIMSIVVLSIPIIMRTNSDALEANIVQEAIFATSAKMMQVLSYPWDEHSIDSNNPGAPTKIVSIPGGSVIYNRYKNGDGDINDTNGSFRVGAILENGHRRFHDYNASDANVTTPLTDNGHTALNNISTSASVLLVNATPSAQGYKNKYEMDVNVSYIPDTPDANNVFVFKNTGTNTPTNMKLISVTIRNATTGDILVKLYSYSANIGEVNFAKRTF